MKKEDLVITHDEKNIKGFFNQYKWLSNFTDGEVYFEGLLYPSTEAAYQSAKTNDMEIRKLFTQYNAGKSKREGRKLVLREGWHDMKYDVMSAITFEKYYRNKDLRALLLQTGDKYLEETNYWEDVYYGVCDGVGENNLGKILMKVREFWNKNEGGFQI